MLYSKEIVFNYSISVTANIQRVGFVPLFAFDSANGKVTLISILPQCIVYLKPSSDPIFYASDYFKGEGIEFWTRTNQLASTLACVDESEVCYKKNCWRSLSDAREWYFAKILDSYELLLNMILLFTALEHSIIFDQLIDNDDNAL